jgi:ABC-type transporter Mla subunit MlaD
LARAFHEFKNFVEAVLEENAQQHQAFANAIGELQAAVGEARQLAAQAINAAQDGNQNLVNLGQNAEAALDKIGLVLTSHEERLGQIIRNYPETFTSRRQTRKGTPMERNRKRVQTIDVTPEKGAALPNAPGISSKNERIANSAAMNEFNALGNDDEDEAEYEDYD